MEPRDFANDPNVAVELDRQARAARAQSAEEIDDGRPRARPDPARNPFAVPGKTVERWPCRGGCGVLIEVTADTVRALEVANAELRRRRDEPIAKSKVMWCPDCRRRDDELRAMQRRPHEQTRLGLEAAYERASGMATSRANKRRNDL